MAASSFLAMAQTSVCAHRSSSRLVDGADASREGTSSFDIDAFNRRPVFDIVDQNRLCAGLATTVDSEIDPDIRSYHTMRHSGHLRRRVAPLALPVGDRLAIDPRLDLARRPSHGTWLQVQGDVKPMVSGNRKFCDRDFLPVSGALRVVVSRGQFKRDFFRTALFWKHRHHERRVSAATLPSLEMNDPI